MHKPSFFSLDSPTFISAYYAARRDPHSGVFILADDRPLNPTAKATIILDLFGRYDGGITTFEVDLVHGNNLIDAKILYSETHDGFNCEEGDGLFFLFSNSMDCYYRGVSMEIAPSTSPQGVRSALAQRSQRFLKLFLMSANSFIALSRIGYSPIRSSLTPKVNFRCCDETLSRTWSDDINTLDTGTVSKGEEAQSCEVQFETNAAANMIDGAERDRITFGGETGSLWLVGPPVHLEDDALPTDDSYSMTYALLLVVAIKNYWLRSGDEDVRDQCLPAAERLLRYTESREKPSGLIEVPPGMSMHRYSLGEPVFGASKAANIAYYDALSAVRAMTHNGYRKFQISAKMEILKRAILTHLDSENAVPE